MKKISLIFCMLLLALASPVYSQEESKTDEKASNKEEMKSPSTSSSKSNFEVGLGIGLSNTPEESDLKKDGTPTDLHLNWYMGEMLNFRFGYAMTSAKTSYTAFKKDWEHTLSSNTIYIAYLYPHAISNEIQISAIAGVASVSSTLTTNNGAATQTASSTGFIAGAGGDYKLSESFMVGAQYNLISASAKLGDTTLATGSNVIAATASYRF